MDVEVADEYALHVVIALQNAHSNCCVVVAAKALAMICKRVMCATGKIDGATLGQGCFGRSNRCAC